MLFTLLSLTNSLKMNTIAKDYFHWGGNKSPHWLSFCGCGLLLVLAFVAIWASVVRDFVTCAFVTHLFSLYLQHVPNIIAR